MRSEPYLVPSSLFSSSPPFVILPLIPSLSHPSYSSPSLNGFIVSDGDEEASASASASDAGTRSASEAEEVNDDDDDDGDEDDEEEEEGGAPAKRRRGGPGPTHPAPRRQLFPENPDEAGEGRGGPALPPRGGRVSRGCAAGRAALAEPAGGRGREDILRHRNEVLYGKPARAGAGAGARGAGAGARKGKGGDRGRRKGRREAIDDEGDDQGDDDGDDADLSDFIVPDEEGEEIEGGFRVKPHELGRKPKNPSFVPYVHYLALWCAPVGVDRKSIVVAGAVAGPLVCCL